MALTFVQNPHGSDIKRPINLPEEGEVYRYDDGLAVVMAVHKVGVTSQMTVVYTNPDGTFRNSETLPLQRFNSLPVGSYAFGRVLWYARTGREEYVLP